MKGRGCSTHQRFAMSSVHPEGMTHMMQTPDFWNALYDKDIGPWVIGEPQPAFVTLEQTGWIRGRVLDLGCGAGEHTIALTRLAYDVIGIDLSPRAVDYARNNAAQKGVPTARFEQGDAVQLGLDPERAAAVGVFDTIIDSALFHCFRDLPEIRAEYVRSLHALCAPSASVHLLALADTEPGPGSRLSDTMIRESFDTGWEVEDLRLTVCRGRITAKIADQADNLVVGPDGKADAPAWIARIRRL